MPSCPITAFAVAADALRVVVVGTESSGMGAGSHGSIWASADGGSAWLAEPISDEFALHPTFGDRGDYGLFSVASGGPTTFVVVGRTAAAGPTAWLGHPFGTPASDRSVPSTGP